MWPVIEYAVVSDHFAVNTRNWFTVMSTVTAAGVADPADPMYWAVWLASVNACADDVQSPIANTVPEAPTERVTADPSQYHIVAVWIVVSIVNAPDFAHDTVGTVTAVVPDPTLNVNVAAVVNVVARPLARHRNVLPAIPPGCM